MIEGYATLWGCAKINESFHDEALTILSTRRFESRNIPVIKSKGIQLLENRSLISEEDLKESLLGGFFFDEDRSTYCKSLKCDKRSSDLKLKWAVFGVLIMILLVLVTIYAISLYCVN